MADCLNTTSPSLVTRRVVLVGAAIAQTMSVAALSQHRPQDSHRGDPVLALCQRWREWHAKADARLAEWQELERSLVETIGFPSVSIPDPDDGASLICATTHSDIDDALGDGPATHLLREQLHDDLEAHQERWDAAAAAVQFDAAEARHNAAFEELHTLTGEIFDTPVASLAGLDAKLSLIVRWGETAEGDSEFPWPQLRSVLNDLRRLVETREHETL